METVPSPRSDRDGARKVDLLPVSLRQLEIFCTVAELGSVSAASRQLMVSQPSVSKQLKALECLLGLSLLERRPRGVALTASGAVLHQHGVKILKAVHELIAEMSMRRQGRGQVTLGIASGVFLVATHLIRDLREHLSSSLDLLTVVANTQELLVQIRAGHIDVALVWDPGRVPDLKVERLFPGEHAVILPRNHPLASKATLTPEDLRTCQWILTPHGTPLRSYVDRTLLALGISARPVMEFSHAEVIKVAVEAGLGVSILARDVVDVEVRAGILVARPILGVPLSRDLCLVMRKTRSIPQAVIRVVALVRAHTIVARKSSGTPPDGREDAFA